MQRHGFTLALCSASRKTWKQTHRRSGRTARPGGGLPSDAYVHAENLALTTTLFYESDVLLNSILVPYMPCSSLGVSAGTCSRTTKMHACTTSTNRTAWPLHSASDRTICPAARVAGAASKMFGVGGRAAKAIFPAQAPQWTVPPAMSTTFC